MSGIRLLFVTAIVVGLALTNQVRALNVLAYTLVAVLLISAFWSRFTVRKLNVKRDLHEFRVQAGQVVEERITIENESTLPRLWLQVLDHSDLPNHQASRVVDLGPKGSRSWLVRTTCKRRGEYFLGPTTLVGADPLGLFHSSRIIGQTQRVIIYPPTEPLAGFSLPIANQYGGAMRRMGYWQTTPHASEVREYAPGDPLNRIHWPSTARTGKFMVKEFDEDPTADIWIFIDLDRSVHLGEEDDSTEEYAVRAAASIGEHFLMRSRSVGFVAIGARPSILPNDRGDRQEYRMLETLAVLRSNGAKPFAEVIASESFRVGKNAVVIAITPSIDESWVRSLGELRLGGQKAVAVVLERGTFGAEDSSLLLVSSLAAADLPTYLIKHGQPLSESLRWTSTHLALGNR